jgi:hypothetical protein
MVDSTASQRMAHALPGLMLRLFSLESAGSDVTRVNAANWVTSIENK